MGAGGEGGSAIGRPLGRKEPLLFARFPELRRSLPWVALCQTPTPVVRWESLCRRLHHQNIWMKRDDLISPLYGGNKIRRFEYLFAEAKNKGAREILTVGGLASTQVVATVLFGRSLGFDVSAVLFDQPWTPFARKALGTSLAAGARLIHGGSYARTTLLALRELGMRKGAYFVWPGASTPLANVGYVDAMLELDAQVRTGELPRPDAIVVPSGSGGTLVGLAIGAALLGWDITIIGVRITDYIACNRATMRIGIERTKRFLEKKSPAFASVHVPASSFKIDHNAVGEGYGYSTKEALTAAEWLTQETGSPSEITYTGKAVSRLPDIARAFPNGNILYWNTLSSVWPALPKEMEIPASFSQFFEEERGRASVPLGL